MRTSPASYGQVVVRHWRLLGFGALLMSMSSAGQTFFIALFGTQVRDAFSLSDGDFGSVYAAATIASALTVAWAGRFVDSMSVRKFTAVIAVMLSSACLLLAWSPSLPVLVVSLYLLRLSGQGLMVHTAMTTVARALPSDRGKAIGLAALGLALGEALFPIAAVGGISSLGWRPVWVANATFVLLGSAVALMLVQTRSGGTPALAAPVLPPGHKEFAIWRNPRFARSLPLLLCAPFMSTGIFFHQARLAQEKDWSLRLIATWFVAYALSRAASLLLIGAVLDRHSAARILPLLAVPLGLAMLLIAVVRQPWVVPVYMLLFGLAAAASSTLETALWAETYGPHRLGRVRALTQGWGVLASGLAPAVMGLLLDRGVSLSAQAVGLLLVAVAAGLFASDLIHVVGDTKPQAR